MQLDAGDMVLLKGVPEFRDGARVVVKETVTRIFRIHRFTFVSFLDQSQS